MEEIHRTLYERIRLSDWQLKIRYKTVCIGERYCFLKKWTIFLKNVNYLTNWVDILEKMRYSNVNVFKIIVNIKGVL